MLENNSGEIIREMEDQIKLALKDAGIYVEGQAKLLSPVDTGNLRGSISSKMNGSTEVQIGTDIDYAVYVEKGTRYMEAQPYLTPALENNIAEIQQIIGVHLEQVGGRI